MSVPYNYFQYFVIFLDYKEEQDGEMEALRSIYTEEEFEGKIKILH